MRKLLIPLLVLVCVLGFTACLRLPQHLPSAEAAFYKAYPMDTVIELDGECREISLISNVVDKYKSKYDVKWQSSNTDIAQIDNREDGVFVLLNPARESCEFTLTATISDNDGDTVACEVNYRLSECVHQKGAAATCVSNQVCNLCGKILNAAKGHRPGPNATCTNPQKCYDCGYVFKKALGHISTDSGDCTVEVKCTRSGCGAVLTPAEPNHVDANVDGKCDVSTCRVVVGIDIDDNTGAAYEIKHNTLYNFNNVENYRISGTNIKVYTDSSRSEEITLPHDLTGKVTYYIEALNDDAKLLIGDRHTIIVNEFVVSEGREIDADSTDGYVTYFTGYDGTFAFYFGNDGKYAAEDNISVQMYIDGEFKNIKNRQIFEIREGEVVTFKVALKSGTGKVACAIFPSPVEDTEYRLGITESGNRLYLSGKTANGVDSWLGTSMDDAVALKLELVISADADADDDVNKDMYRLYFINDNGEKVYVRMFFIASGKKAGLELTSEEPEELYTYDEEYRTLVFTDKNGAKHFLGAAPEDNVITSYQWGKIEYNAVVHFYLY